MKTHRNVMHAAAYALAFVPLFLISFVDAQYSLEPPTQFRTIQELISAALRVLVIVALPIIALFVVISGFMFVFARGNQEKLSKAKNNFLYVMLGALLILGASLLSSILGATVTEVIGR